ALTLPELQASVDLATTVGRAELIRWWMSKGRTLDGFVDLVAPRMYAEASPLVEQDQPLVITRGLHALALALPELQAFLDLATNAGRAELIRWWMCSGRTLDAFTDLVTPGMCAEASPLVEQDQPLVITRGLHALALALPELQASIDLANAAGRTGLIGWWMCHGLNNPVYAGLGGNDDWSALSPMSCDPPLITRGLHALWISREDLQRTFDISEVGGRRRLADWYREYGEGVLDQPPRAQIPLMDRVDSDTNTLCLSGQYLNTGVNILGYGRGEFGIGEDVRMAFTACEVAGIDACVPRLPLRIGARQNDLSVVNAETDVPIYNTNLICLPFFETLRLLGKTRETILDRRYNIAFWQWELPNFPHSMKCVLDVADEIWASSAFTASAMCAATTKPVFQMPMVVRLPVGLSQWTRKDFGLPEDHFVFLTVLDGNSSLKRKNPLAVVRAFTAAFPKSKHVRLLVKAMNVNEAQSDWLGVVEHAARDERISLVVETMTKDKLLGLQSVCDCFVSLHRSEGFGRNIAEAMLLGKPVIVSDYSGNRDFTTEKTAFLVQGRTIPLAQGDYAFGEGQVWFDPDVGAAAEAFHRCLDQAESRNSIASAGRAFVHARYSPEAVGAAYAQRLAHVSAS
ncbi:glycosyltransferase family 4 protein, partial [Aromatoleum evansii]|uniref:glycosyltransferase family 4 protein n=1 Tax=Aromatoleum evansii TaxID=59406 RepID=UPI00145E98E6